MTKLLQLIGVRLACTVGCLFLISCTSHESAKEPGVEAIKKTPSPSSSPAETTVSAPVASPAPKQDSQQLATPTVRSSPDTTESAEQATARWISPLTSSPQEIMPDPDETSLVPPTEGRKSVRIFVFDRVRNTAAAGVELEATGNAFEPQYLKATGNRFVTNSVGFTRVVLAEGHENDQNATFRLTANWAPLTRGVIRVLPANETDQEFTISLQPSAKDTVRLDVYPVLRVEARVLTEANAMASNIEVTFVPVDAIAKTALSLKTAGESESMAGARFAIPLNVGDSYKVTLAGLTEEQQERCGTDRPFQVGGYRKPIVLNLRTYPPCATDIVAEEK